MDSPLKTLVSCMQLPSSKRMKLLLLFQSKLNKNILTNDVFCTTLSSYYEISCNQVLSSGLVSKSVLARFYTLKRLRNSFKLIECLLH